LGRRSNQGPELGLSVEVAYVIDRKTMGDPNNLRTVAPPAKIGGSKGTSQLLIETAADIEATKGPDTTTTAGRSRREAILSLLLPDKGAVTEAKGGFSHAPRCRAVEDWHKAIIRLHYLPQRSSRRPTHA
jgi:hypothetical protein